MGEYLVERAVELGNDVDADVKEFAAPPGFPFLVSVRKGEAALVEPASLYLCSKFLLGPAATRSHRKVRTRVFSDNTALACANDLKDWWEFLEHFDLAWDRVTLREVRRYRDVMFQTISPRTHLPYARQTVRRRMSTVIDFYRWAKDEGRALSDLSPDQLIEATRSFVPIDRRPFAHLSTAIKSKTNHLLPALKRDVDDLVRAFVPSEYRILAEHLGPLPSESDGARRSRDRLAVELSLNSGMRIDEVTSLTKWQIFDLGTVSESLYAVHLMPISKTKGLKARRVEVPHWLLEELLVYLQSERSEAVAEGRRRGLKKEPAALFVNGVSARHNAGKPFTKDSMDDVFRRAVVAAGFTRKVEKTSPDTYETYLGTVPRFSFHCLRHTFAIWRYYAERKSGNHEPWKIIQALLGHQSLSTTTDLYLRATAEFEAQVSDEVLRFFGAIRNA